MPNDTTESVAERQLEAMLMLNSYWIDVEHM